MDEERTFYCSPEEIAIAMKDGCLSCNYGRCETEVIRKAYDVSTLCGKSYFLNYEPNVKVQVYCMIKPTVELVWGNISETFYEYPAIGGYLNRREFLNKEHCKNWIRSEVSDGQEKESK